MAAVLERDRNRCSIAPSLSGCHTRFCMTETAVIEGYVILTLSFHQEGRRWLGECVELGTATHGANLAQTMRELKELVLLHINELEDVGERPRFFAEHGITLYPAQPQMVQLELPVSNDNLIVAQAWPIQIPARAA